jgi:hypothetical protein
MEVFQKKKRRLWPYFLLAFFFLSLLAGWWSYKWIKNLTPADIVESDFIREYVIPYVDQEEQKLFDFLPDLLGIAESKNYLVLFLNNTELRPGGGFIGSYAVVTVSRGEIDIVKVEGTEKFGRNARDDWRPVPPTLIKEHLGTDRWYFRDSNWSPDFSVGAQKAMELYIGQGGILEGEIDMVVGITTTALEEIMKITGPVTVQEIEFTADNVIEKLEYDVEYGFEDRGIRYEERKQIMKPLADAIMGKVKNTIFHNFDKYEEFVKRLTRERHLMVYSIDGNLEDQFREFDLTGLVVPTTGDYLMWVDANLAALKTDHAMERTLSYSIEKNETGQYVAIASMVYEHRGVFDWRTSRYRTYARVFVPKGSGLVKVEGSMKMDHSSAPGRIDMGIELDKQWFGTFISIEPGNTKTLSFRYILPADIQQQIENGLYTLFVQKQLGTIAHGLTLDLDFGTNITSATPAELKSEWGDGIYRIKTDLRVDRSFEVYTSS